MWDVCSTEWVAHLVGGRRLPAEVQQGGGGQQQTRLLAHEQRAVGGAQQRELHREIKKRNPLALAQGFYSQKVRGQRGHCSPLGFFISYR